MALEYKVLFRRYAPFATFGGGFNGDNRTSPSVKTIATARTTGRIDFDRSSASITGYSSGSHHTSGMSAMGSVYAKISIQTTQANSISMWAHTAGSNPLVPMVSPDIDTFLKLTFNFFKNKLIVQGTVSGDDFPNAEVIVYDAAWTAALVFDYRTGGGQQTGPSRLFGSHADQKLGFIHASIPMDASGRFTQELMLASTITG
jgi:hypothetical protein